MSISLLHSLIYGSPAEYNTNSSRTATGSVTLSVTDATGDSGDNRDNRDPTDDGDIPPTFPSLNSVQRSAPAPTMSFSVSRSRSSNGFSKAKRDAELMPPPSNLPVNKTSTDSSNTIPDQLSPYYSPSISSANGFRASSASSSNSLLQLPPSTLKPPTLKPRQREKVVLAPGHSTLDWAALKKSGKDLRGVPTILRVTPSMLKTHRLPDDAWTSINGKVYNITPYLDFHPGGVKELMRVAGRDGTKLFALTHSWVNVELMLDECLVGFLINEPSS